MALILPILMLHRQPIQRLPVILPARHVAVDQGQEAGVVGWLEQVNQFVDEDVF